MSADSLERSEVPKSVNLRLVESHGDKNFMVGFDGRTEEECYAYNAAIRVILDKAGMKPFHQVGSGTEQPSYHAWEVWVPVSREQMEALLPKIEEFAQEWLHGRIGSG